MIYEHPFLPSPIQYIISPGQASFIQTKQFTTSSYHPPTLISLQWVILLFNTIPCYDENLQVVTSVYITFSSTSESILCDSKNSLQIQWSSRGSLLIFATDLQQQY